MAVSSSLISRSSLLDPLCGLPSGVGGLPFWPSRVSTLTFFFRLYSCRVRSSPVFHFDALSEA